MRITEKYKLYEQAVEKWGMISQENMLIEECAELIKATNKMDRENSCEAIDNFFEELADVEIMVEQIIHVNDIRKTVNEIKEQKLQRLKRLIENDN